MSTLWLREITTTTMGDSTGLPFSLKVLALFLRYCCGGSVSSSVTANTGTGDTLTRGGSSPNWTVTLACAGAYFDPTIVGKSITITGATNGNNGTFTISSRPSATSLVWTNTGSLGNTPSGFSWSISGTYDWYSTEKTGTNGAFNTGTNKRFRDTVAASFVSGDTGKWVLVVSANARNCGLYKATYVDANNVDLDFRAGTVEYPTAETGLTWYLLSDSFEVPYQIGTYFRLDMPGGWGLEGTPSYSTGFAHKIRVAPDNTDWSKLLGPIYAGSVASATNWLYAAFETTGLNLSVMLHQATNSRHNGYMVAKLDSVDTRDAIEKVALMGNTGSGSADHDSGNFVRDYNTKRMGHGYVWNTVLAAQQDVYMLEPAYLGYATGLSTWTARERNRRRSGSGTAGGGTGDSISMSGSTATLTDAGGSFSSTDIGKMIRVSGATNAGNNGAFTVTASPSGTSVQFINASGVNETSSFLWSMDREDLISGTWIITDENNAAGRYELVGRIKGHYSVRSGTTSGWNVRKAFDQDGYLDKYHFNAGIAFDWPGVIPQH